jgi:hypothetical protein
MKFAGWHPVVLAESTIAVNPQRLVVVAAVGVSSATRMTALAVQVGLYAAPISRTHVRDPVADRHHFDTQFMPGNPRVGKEGHLAQVAAEVGTANAHLMDANHSLTRAGSRRFVDVDDPERSGLFQLDGLHARELGRGLMNEVRAFNN